MKARSLAYSKVEEDIGSHKRGEEYKSERFDIFMGLVLAIMNTSFDANKFEDFARFLLGSKAYLLFAFEKLIAAVNK